MEEKYQSLQDKYDLLEQKFQSQTEVDSSIKQNGNNLSSSSYSNHEDKIHQLQNEYDDLKMELTRVGNRSYCSLDLILLLSGSAT